MVNDVADTRNPSYMRELSRQYDIPITSLAVPKGGNQKIFESILRIAEELNVPVLSIRSPEWSDFQYKNFLTSELPRIQNLTRVKLCVENPPLGDSVFLPMNAFGNINELKRFKYLTLDTSHLFSRNLDLMRVYSLLKGNIAHIHLSDVRKNREHQPLGSGVLPLESFLTRLHKDKYQGQIVLKIDFNEMGYDEKQVEEKLRDMKTFFEKYYFGDTEEAL